MNVSSGNAALENVSPGSKFQQALKTTTPLLLVGVMNAYVAKMANSLGFQAIYMSGACVANSSFGLPDLGFTSLRDVVLEVQKITSAVDLPLIVDADTGWGSDLNTAYTTKELIKAGAAGMHIEDQTWPKRCGHREGKTLITTADMVAKIKSAVQAKIDVNSSIKNQDPNFFIIARTDAIAVEGIEKAIARAKAYVAAGADAIFAEAVTELAQYKQFVAQIPDVPILANITEFGKTPLFNVSELDSVGVQIALFPLSAFRAMNKAAFDTLQTIKQTGSQQTVTKNMQTREELYDILDYDKYEQQV